MLYNPRGDNREADFKERTAKHFPELMKDMHPQTENAYNGLTINQYLDAFDEIEEYKM